MSYGTPIGYVWEGGVYCKDCMDASGGSVTSESEEVGAIFEESESDYPEHCGDCHEFLGGALTTEGKRWLREQWVEHRWRDFALIETYMQHYDSMDWYFIFTFWGWMDPLGNLKD